MIKIIGKAYYWVWHDILCREEPFTWQFRRMAKKHPVIWIATGTGFFGFWTWLLLHLGGLI